MPQVQSKITELANADGYTVRGLSRSAKDDGKLRSIGAEPVRVDTLGAHLNEDYSAVVRDNNLAIDAVVKGIHGAMKLLIVASGSAIAKSDPKLSETDETSPLSINGINRRYECEQHALDQESKGVRIYSIRSAPYIWSL